MNNFKENLTAKLQELEPSYLEIIDESHLHSSHFKGEALNTHFKIVIRSKFFKDLPPVQRHKMIYKILNLELQNQIHALSIIATD